MNDIELIFPINTAASLYRPEHFGKSPFPCNDSPKTCILNMYPFLFEYTKILSKSSEFKLLTNILLNVKFLCTDSLLFIFNTFGASFTGLIMELCIHWGCENFYLFGSAGIMNPVIESGSLILPDQIIRDEGTSFHYSNPSRMIRVNPILSERFSQYLTKKRLPYHRGLHWTTDAPFRETPLKVKRLQEEGCISVDMEASAVIAIADHYKKNCMAVLTGLDHLDYKGWTAVINRKEVIDIIKNHYQSLIHFINSEMHS